MPKTIDDRAKFFNNKLSKVLKDSHCFHKSDNETVSSYIFRATHAINIFQKYRFEKAATELNHARVETNSKHYIKAEDRELLKTKRKNYSTIT